MRVVGVIFIEGKSFEAFFLLGDIEEVGDGLKLLTAVFEHSVTVKFDHTL
jgi:hypothetical protein